MPVRHDLVDCHGKIFHDWCHLEEHTGYYDVHVGMKSNPGNSYIEGSYHNLSGAFQRYLLFYLVETNLDSVLDPAEAIMVQLLVLVKPEMEYEEESGYKDG